MIDFTAFSHPFLAVPCPHCSQEAGVRCIMPNGRRTNGSHRARADKAAEILTSQHGGSASLRPARQGWEIEHGACL
ncbi:MAG TPA: hypothetical protein PLL33_14535 [Paracoccus sp. (in: a-proteobacteria)]|nr:hypothetical protein [Paracoccus sp. (in: a-proteobacteria)]